MGPYDLCQQISINDLSAESEEQRCIAFNLIALFKQLGAISYSEARFKPASFRIALKHNKTSIGACTVCDISAHLVQLFALCMDSVLPPQDMCAFMLPPPPLPPADQAA